MTHWSRSKAHLNVIAYVACGLALTLAPGSAVGQNEEPGEGGGGNCSIDCIFCTGSPNHWIGDGTCTQCHGTQYRNDYCRNGSCLTCSGLSAAESTVLDDIANRLTQADASELAELVQYHGRRMLIHAPRRLVVLLGGCDGQGLQAVAFVPAGAIAALEALGIPSLESYAPRPTQRGAR